MKHWRNWGECVRRIDIGALCTYLLFYGVWKEGPISLNIRSISLYRIENPGKICHSPTNVHAQLVTGEPYQYAGEQVTINTHVGFYCKKKEQKDNTCHDYRVRFCCPKRMLVASICLLVLIHVTFSFVWLTIYSIPWLTEIKRIHRRVCLYAI